MACPVDADSTISQFTPPQADALYEPFSRRIAEDRSIGFTANWAPQDQYPLFPDPVVTESLLGRLINASHQVFMSCSSHRPNELPGAAITKA
ncbi:hypothetical protein OHA04_02745 [Streptomyces sp. NBC_01590]|uniref:hypothetical protein n=1 Tax=Streptomyces sp. NBC_01590 TaxID=2975887 RepID=UPI00386AF03E